MRELRTHSLIESAEHALGAPVLWRCIWAGHAQRNAATVEEITGSVVIELAPVVSLECEDGEVEVSGGESMEPTDGGKGVGFESQRERPGKMTVII